MASKKGGRKSTGKRGAKKRPAAKRSATKAAKKQPKKSGLSAAERDLAARARELDRREARLAVVERHLTRRDIVARITARAWADPMYKQRLIDDPALRQELGAAARACVIAKWTWKHNAQRIIEVCERALRR